MAMLNSQRVPITFFKCDSDIFKVKPLTTYIQYYSMAWLKGQMTPETMVETTIHFHGEAPGPSSPVSASRTK